MDADAQRRVGWGWRPRAAIRSMIVALIARVDHRQDFFLSPFGLVVPPGEHAHPGQPDLGRGHRRQSAGPGWGAWPREAHSASYTASTARPT